MVDVTKTHEVVSHKHDSPLVACRYDPGGKSVYFAGQDNRVWRWEIGTDKKVEFAGHDSWVPAIAFHPSEPIVWTGGYDGRLIWWNSAEEKSAPQRIVEAHQGWLRSVDISADGRQIATAGNDNLVKLWDAAEGKLIRQFSGHERHVYRAIFHPDGKQIASGDLMGHLHHWEVETGKLLRKFHLKTMHKYDTTFKADIGGFRAMSFSPDGKLLASSGITNVTNAFAGVGNPIVELWDWEAGKQKIAQLSKAKLRGVAWGVALHPEQITIALSGGGGGGFLLFWKFDQENEFHQLKLKNTARGMDLSPDLQHVATAHYDGHLRIYKIAAK